MPFDFHNKRVVVTGGANGIGLAVSRSFAAAGASVSILDLSAEKPAEVAQTLGAQGYAVDVSDKDSVDDAFNHLNDSDIVVAGAGIAPHGPLMSVPADVWNRTLAVNLTGVFHTVQAAAACMKRRKGGAIVLIASTNSYDGEPELVAYNASKAGLLGILHTAANELGPYRIRVNAVCPGFIRTRLTESQFSRPELISEYFKHIALGRGGEPAEVAHAVLFLASDLASYITGATLLVDGGQMASKFGTWQRETDIFDGQRWTRNS
ncbi:MAG: SDR family oxidoreductase [Acidobacteriaceae bacterium]|nr:SDR family oxidoreductase [Acidobacteriaceae bacterium]